VNSGAPEELACIYLVYYQLIPLRVIRSHKSTGRQYNHQKEKKNKRVRVRIRVFMATFNNFSVILWRSVLLVEEYPGTTPFGILDSYFLRRVCRYQ
jgi:uncharacterized membrane protein (UPF0182 family)